MERDLFEDEQTRCALPPVHLDLNGYEDFVVHSRKQLTWGTTIVSVGPCQPVDFAALTMWRPGVRTPGGFSPTSDSCCQLANSQVL